MRRGGFSLIELMMVVTIVGLLAAMSAFALTSVNELGRINGGAQVVANVLRTARTRAITERCTYVVQMNGPNYNPLAAPDVPRSPSTIILWRKNNCQSTVGAYEGGLAPPLRDRRVNDYSMAEFNTSVFFSPGVTTEPLNRLRVGSVSVAWQPDGTRTVWSDPDGDGTSVLSGFAPAATLGIDIRSPKGTPSPSRIVSTPPDGPAVAP